MRSDEYVCNLSQEVMEVAKRELGETPERRAQDIEAIREWLKKNPYLKADTSAKSIVSFLRVAKFSLERTKERMEFFYSVKEAAPELFGNCDPMRPEIQTLLKCGPFLPLNGTDNKGRRVIMLRTGVLDPQKSKMEDQFKVGNMILNILLDEFEDVAIMGIVFVLDHKQFSTAHLSLVSPSLLKKAFKSQQDCRPVRVKGIHHYNTSSVFQTVFNLIKPLLKEKMKNRVFLHGQDLNSLQKEIPKEILPVEYGGSAGTVDDITKEWKKKLESRRDFLMEQDQFKTDESKRPGPKRDLNAALFGIEGSFRKLQVD